MQAQEQIRQQYGSLLRGRPHKLHIVRVMHSGSVGDRPSAAAFISRAICAKAALLQSNGEPSRSYPDVPAALRCAGPLLDFTVTLSSHSCVVAVLSIYFHVAVLLQSSWWAGRSGSQQPECHATVRWRSQCAATAGNQCCSSLKSTPCWRMPYPPLLRSPRSRSAFPRQAARLRLA